MWVWEVDEVIPIHLFIIKPMGVTSMLLYCYARRRGLGLSVFMTDVSIVN